MNIKEVKDLIHEVLQSDISEFELEHTGTRVKLKRGHSVEVTAVPPVRSQPDVTGLTVPQAPVPEHSTPQTVAGNAEDAAFHFITSPLVGTFFSSSSPGADPYVQLGDHVREGSVLCIIEAMKLMNEVPSDVEGEVVRIYAETGTPVEFGQKLFAIRPKQG